MRNRSVCNKFVKSLAYLAVASVGAAFPLNRSLIAAEAPTLPQTSRDIRDLDQKSAGTFVRLLVPRPKWVGDYLSSTPGAVKDLDAGARQNLIPHPPRSQMTIAQTPTASHSAHAEPGTPAPAVTPAVPSSPMGIWSGEPGAAADQGVAVGLRIDDSGHIVLPIYIEPETAAAHPISFGTPDGQTHPAKFVGSDRATNLTVIEVEGLSDKAQPLSFSTIRDGAVLRFVSVIDGSARISQLPAPADPCFVQTLDGSVVAIAASGHVFSATNLKRVCDALIRDGKIDRPSLGLVATQTGGAVSISRIIPDSPASRAKLQVGDLIMKLNGPVTGVADVAAGLVLPGDHVDVSIARGDRRMALRVELQK